MTLRIRHLIGPKDVQALMCNGPVTGPWVRAVPIPLTGGLLARLSDAWAVLRGRAHAVAWPKPGELEEALRK